MTGLAIAFLSVLCFFSGYLLILSLRKVPKYEHHVIDTVDKVSLAALEKEVFAKCDEVQRLANETGIRNVDDYELEVVEGADPNDTSLFIQRKIQKVNRLTEEAS